MRNTMCAPVPCCCLTYHLAVCTDLGACTRVLPPVAWSRERQHGSSFGLQEDDDIPALPELMPKKRGSIRRATPQVRAACALRSVPPGNSRRGTAQL